MLINGKLFYILISLFGGISSSLSPCTIALLPLILAYVCGTKNCSFKDLSLKLLSFSFGLSAFLSILGLFCAFAGKVFSGFDLPIFIIIFGSVMMILGLQLSGIVDIQIPTVIKEIPQIKTNSNFLYPFFIGILFALLSSPCSSPILLGIMAIATKSSDYFTSFMMLFSFAFGQCIIIILAGLFASFLKNLQKIQKYTDFLVKLSGWIFIIFAICVWVNIYSDIINR
jgi:cytochrome c-type biogenesis protein